MYMNKVYKSKSMEQTHTCVYIRVRGCRQPERINKSLSAWLTGGGSCKSGCCCCCFRLAATHPRLTQGGGRCGGGRADIVASFPPLHFYRPMPVIHICMYIPLCRSTQAALHAHCGIMEIIIVFHSCYSLRMF